MSSKEILKSLNQASLSLSVIMPVYNEGRRVSHAIEEVLKAAASFELELIVVESGSSDGSREIVERYSKHPNVTVILQDKARGKGNAVRAGLKKATNKVICIFDSDLEYIFEDIFNLMLPIAAGKSEFVLGSRWVGHSIRDFETHNWKAILLNIAHVVGAQLINILFGIKAKDPFTMWKVFTRTSVSDINFISERFDWDLEVVGELALKGIKPIEIPANYSSRDYSEGKKIRFWEELPVLLKVIFRIFFKRIYKSISIERGA